MTKRNRILSVFICLCLLLAILPGSTGSVFAATTPDAASANAARNTTSTLTFYFDNYYNADTFNVTRRAYINTAVAFVTAAYQQACATENISISFASSGSPVADTVTSLSDCDQGADLPCRLTYVCGDYYHHHKDVKNIADRLYTNITRQPNHLTVLWTDFDPGVYCYYHTEYDVFGDPIQQVHEYPDWCGVVFGSRPVIHIMDLQDPVTADQYRARMSLLLAHETMHTFGIEDSYDEQEAHEYDNARTCVMDYSRDSDTTYVDFYNDALDGRVNAFCDYCIDCLTGVLIYDYL